MANSNKSLVVAPPSAYPDQTMVKAEPPQEPTPGTANAVVSSLQQKHSLSETSKELLLKP